MRVILIDSFFWAMAILLVVVFLILVMVTLTKISAIAALVIGILVAWVAIIHLVRLAIHKWWYK